MAVVEKALEPVRDWRQFKAWMALQPPKEKVTGEASGYRSTLVMAGLAVCDDDIPPASPSLHESALYQQPVSLQLPALDETRLKLGRDRLYMASKYGGSLQASMERARFFVELPESPQHRKFCYETKVDTSRSEIAKQVAQEVEEAKEEERKIARRNSLMKIKEGGLSPLMMAQETADPSRRYRIVEKVIKRNRMPEDILEEVWEKIEEAPATVSSRSIALVLMQRVVAASNCPASLEGPLFNFIRNKHKEFVKERPGLSMNQESFVEFCRFCGVLLECAVGPGPASIFVRVFFSFSQTEGSAVVAAERGGGGHGTFTMYNHVYIYILYI
ncbi:unnamed protein product [Durusdinium trenchii]|uniref:Uncharacterized protein n=1 Tax=Durusdinium trenchii TaxID=1381693 RepID=A0ABP0QSF7_9DINO